MRLATTSRLLTSRLAAAAIMLAAVSIAAPGYASDNDSKASSASSSSCGATHGTTATAASMKHGAQSQEAGGCCSMKSSASASKAAASCPMSGTAACPPGMCSASTSVAASTANMNGACWGDAMTSGAHKPSTKTTRTASATRKRALKSKTAAKSANGSTAVNVTPGTAGLVAVIDPETGGIVQATAEQLAQISASASKLPGGVSTQGRVPDAEIIALPGGGEMMRVPDRLMMNATATRSANGKITYGCQQGNGPIAPVPAEAPVAVPQSTWEVK